MPDNTDVDTVDHARMHAALMLISGACLGVGVYALTQFLLREYLPAVFWVLSPNTSLLVAGVGSLVLFVLVYYHSVKETPKALQESRL